MKIFRFLMSVAAIITSPAALAEDFATQPNSSSPVTETITTTKTIDRVEEDGSTQPLEKEVKTESVINIPVETKIDPTTPLTTVPCHDLPVVSPTDEFIENNQDDDSDIASETEFEVLRNEKGEIGYALDEVPEELFEENPVNPETIAKSSNAPSNENDIEVMKDIESSVDEALDEGEIEAIKDARRKNVSPAPRVIDPANDVNAPVVKP